MTKTNVKSQFRRASVLASRLRAISQKPIESLVTASLLLCRYAMNFVRGVPNRQTLLPFAGCVLCFLFFIVMAVAWWQTVGDIASVRPDILPFQEHLKNVRRVFAQVRFSGTMNGDASVILESVGIWRDPDEPDTDGDGLLDSEELALGTNPKLRDSDRDGLWDSTEIRLLLDPSAVDSKGDGISDGERDTDRDGCSNFEEQRAGYDPGNRNNSPARGTPRSGHGSLTDNSFQWGYPGRIRK